MTPTDLDQVVARPLRGGADHAQLFLLDSEGTQVTSLGGVLSGAGRTRGFGAGLRVLRGTDAVHVHTQHVDRRSLLDLADRAVELLGATPAGAEPPSPGSSPPARPDRIEPREDRLAAAAAVVTDADRALRVGVQDLLRLRVDLSTSDRRVRVVDSDGLDVQDRRRTVRMRVVVALGQRSVDYSRWDDRFVGGTLPDLTVDDAHLRFGRDLLRRTADARRGVPVRRCRVPVVLERGATGVFFHEACGHMLEGGAVADGFSPYAGRLGQQVASSRVTLVDDATLPGLPGSGAVDDEGRPARRTVLIQDGVLVSYLLDELSARRLGVPGTGSGRRQDHTFAPGSRMSNTFALPGTDDDDEMISSIDEGLYVGSSLGGNGGPQFTIEAADAFWIEDGRLTHPVRDLTLTGDGITALTAIDRVGRLPGGSHGAFCGAGSGLVPTTTGGPRIRFAALDLG